MSYVFDGQHKVECTGDNVTYTDTHITATFEYHTTKVSLTKPTQPQTPSASSSSSSPSKSVPKVDQVLTAQPNKVTMQIQTERRVPRTGVMFVGWGGNNGATVTAGLLANKHGITWETKEGVQKPNYFGSITQASTIRLGMDQYGNDYFVPFGSIVPLVHPNELVISGWDICKTDLAQAMRNSKVLDIDLQKKLTPYMEKLVPLPSVYVPDFIAANQSDRANNVISGTMKEKLNRLIADIEGFKKKNDVQKVIVLWTANTERFSEIQEGVNDTAANLLAAIDNEEEEIAPSTLFAVASILTKSAYINGSPQNTFVPGVIELAQQHNVFIAGDDFKSGQTKLKSVLVDFLVSAGIKPRAIVSYNHLGNNDGKNLSAPKQFRSKEISKSNVVDDMVASNGLLYDLKNNEAPDHCVVIKYVPYVGDSKRAMDEYTSEIFMNGKNTIVIHNTCEDSLLATPLIIDLVILTEFLQRVQFKSDDLGLKEFDQMHSVLSVLSYLLKAPLTPPGTPVVNALFSQRQAITNLLRACVGLPPENHMLLEHRLQCAGKYRV